MGKWAQARHRGGGGINPAPLPAPVLVAEGGPILEWTWDLTDPDSWEIDESDDGSSGWVAFAFPAGPDRSNGPVNHLKFYRIIGLDVDNNPVTSYSNVEHAP